MFRFSEKATKVSPLFWHNIVKKVAGWKKQKLNCLLLWLCVYIFKKYSQFLRHWESGQCFAVRNSVFLWQKPKENPESQFGICWELCILKHFFHRATSKCQTKWVFFQIWWPSHNILTIIDFLFLIVQYFKIKIIWCSWKFNFWKDWQRILLDKGTEKLLENDTAMSSTCMQQPENRY